MSISVNLIAGSGATGNWIFSGMARRLVQFADPNEFDIVMTEAPDLSRQYDIYHYLHSTLAVQHGKNLHRSLVTVVALDDIAEHRTFANKRETLQRCRRMSTICRDVRDSLIYQGAPAGNIDYTPIGVDLDAFSPTGENRGDILLRHVDAINCTSDRLDDLLFDLTRIGIIGRSYPDGRKGEEFLSRVLSELVRRNKSNIRMVFIGGWNGRGIVEASNMGGSTIKYEEHIIDKTCTYEDYPDLYETLDGVVVTSKTESGPACILEALAKGLPVVSTPGGMANEFLTKRIWMTKEKIGAVIPYGDVHGFADAIQGHILNLSAKRSLSIRREVSQILVDPTLVHSTRTDDNFPDEYPYSWENWSARFQRIYREMASEIKGKQFFLDHIGAEEKKKIDGDFRQMADSSLPDTYLENFLHIMDYCRRGVGLKDFNDVIKGKPSIVVGVGPSLTEQLPLIAQNQDRVVIIACDAAIPVLTKAGIIPHVVVVADPSMRQIPNFRGTDCSGFLTVMPTIVHPMTFHESRKSDCKVAWYNIMMSGPPIYGLIPKVIGLKGSLIPGVLTTGMAMQVAMYMGSWPITFVGHDLCWYDVNGEGYADGIDPSKIDYQRANKMAGDNIMIIPDMNGNRVTTEINFFVFADWINGFLDNNDLRIYNSTGCGILYGERIVQMPLDDWIGKFSIGHDVKTDLMNRYTITTNRVDQQCCHQYDEGLLEEIRSIA